MFRDRKESFSRLKECFNPCTKRMHIRDESGEFCFWLESCIYVYKNILGQVDYCTRCSRIKCIFLLLFQNWPYLSSLLVILYLEWEHYTAVRLVNKKKHYLQPSQRLSGYSSTAETMWIHFLRMCTVAHKHAGRDVYNGNGVITVYPCPFSMANDQERGAPVR